MTTGEGMPLDLFAVPPVPEGPSIPEERVWTISELNRTVRTLLESWMPELWVGGEIANWTRARSGHLYFSLKDEAAQLRCVMWKRDAVRLPVDPDEGMRVRALGSLTLYEARGEYQLTVRRLEGEGEEGLWRLAFERLRTRLAEEGLLDPARKRAIPRFPGTIGIVTSPSGAALHDILTVLGRRAPWTRVLLCGARVQGEGAAGEIAAALRALSESGRVDLIIVGRGGGSIEDLWAFNEEPVARAIAESRVPVISGVGHEVDVTIADLVADLRAPTPSAAAEAAVQDGRVVSELLAAVRPRLARALRRQAERRTHRLDLARMRLVQGVKRLAEPRRRMLERRQDALAWGVRHLIQERRETLGGQAARVETLSPLSTLRRGYAVPIGAGGRVLKKAADFRAEPTFHLRVVDGHIECETLGVSEEGV
ncbi:MAG: exodeoxyribonuclease VII large subunit [Gemmatimonadota bacterium]